MIAVRVNPKRASLWIANVRTVTFRINLLNSIALILLFQATDL